MMHELKRTLENHIDGTAKVEEELRKGAINWAAYCLQELDGELMTKGLHVSQAIAEYLNERERIVEG